MELMDSIEMDEFRKKIEHELAILELNSGPEKLYDPIRYVFSNGGKRVRAVLLLLSYKLFSDEIDKALPAALAIEIFHNFTLVHDDIMDSAPLRRNKETIHKKFGQNTAILSGDAMMVKAYQKLGECDKEVLGKVLKNFNDAALKVCEGQQFDMDFESNDHITIDDYLLMIELKTAVLLAVSAKIGGLIGGGSMEDVNLLHEFGKNIGLAFQLQDDLLDLYGDQGKFGKQAGGDVISKKKTYLYLSYMEVADPEMADQLTALIFSENISDEEKVLQVRDLYSSLNVKTKTMEKIKFYHLAAMQNLKDIEVSEKKKIDIKKLANDLLVREL